MRVLREADGTEMNVWPATRLPYELGGFVTGVILLMPR
jgi:hypothetical protein